jgi:DNA-binding transcriptional LysR family regulator
MAIELSHLRYFRATAAAGQLTSAAEQLRITQPTLTAAIRSLERQLGVVLFTRHPRGVRLTPEGERFLKASSEALAGLDDAIAAVRATGRAAPTLRVGIHGPAWPEITDLMGRFRQLHPDVTVLERELTLVTQDYALVHGQVDVAVNVGVPDDVRRRVKHLRTEPRLLALPVDHRLTRFDRLTLPDVVGEPFVRLHPATPRWFGDLFGLHHERGDQRVDTADEASTAQEVISLVAHTGGLFTAPQTFSFGALSPGVAFLPVDGLTPVTLDLVAMRANHNPLVDQLFSLATEVNSLAPPQSASMQFAEARQTSS